MDTLTWTFVRGDEDEERLTIVRDPGIIAPRVRLVVVTNDEARLVDFNDLEAAVWFQSDMETLLLRTGWSFTEFSPERRGGKDRRDFPRIRDRRRWWTDGSVSAEDYLPRSSDESGGQPGGPGRRGKRD